MPNSILENIHRRFLIFKGEIYPIHPKELDKYWKRFSSLQTKSGDLFPWWFSVSSWIYEDKKIKILKNKKFSEDIPWAQFCIFLSVRILDDIFDYQAKDSKLIFVPHLLHLEADKQFAKYFPNNSPFWKTKNDFQQKTLVSIIHADQLQRNRKTEVKDLLKAYANVAAIFKIAITAIFEMEKDSVKLRLFYKFANELAIISQLFDDFYDILEDLKLGKINSAVRIILDMLTAGSIDNITKRTAHALQYKGGFKKLEMEIIKHIQKAKRLAKNMRIEQAVRHVESFGNDLKILASDQHNKRVEFFFNRLKSSYFKEIIV